ncbi:MAG: 4Fe-4S dicluster domain-containing protein [Prevotellaceae bacterium]|nr:4Fe-4S dicluster domain-containing protein [Prevotellaceae bacterium]
MEIQHKALKRPPAGNITRRQALKYACAGIVGVAGAWLGLKHTLLKDYFSETDGQAFHPLADKRPEQVPCIDCRYCMPCPAGVNIPLVFKTYNKCINENNVPDLHAPRNRHFRKKRRTFLVSMNNFVPEKERAERCIGCNRCLPLCPQRIAITNRMHEISGLIKALQ